MPFGLPSPKKGFPGCRPTAGHCHLRLFQRAGGGRRGLGEGGPRGTGFSERLPRAGGGSYKNTNFIGAEQISRWIAHGHDYTPPSENPGRPISESRPSDPLKNTSAPKRISTVRAPGQTVFAIPYAKNGGPRRGCTARGSLPRRGPPRSFPLAAIFSQRAGAGDKGQGCGRSSGQRHSRAASSAGRPRRRGHTARHPPAGGRGRSPAPRRWAEAAPGR